MIDVRAELGFDSIRVYFGETLHIDLRRSTYRGMQAWKWEDNFKIEFCLDGSTMLVEYTDETLWRAVLDGLAKLPLNGE